MERATQRDFERSHVQLQRRLEAIRRRPNSITVAVRLKEELERREARAGGAGLRESATASERVAAILEPYPTGARASKQYLGPAEAHEGGPRPAAGQASEEVPRAAPTGGAPRAMRRTGLWLSDAMMERELGLAQRDWQGMRSVEAVDQLRKDAASLKVSHAELTRECAAIRRRAQADERQRALARSASAASWEGGSSGAPKGTS